MVVGGDGERWWWKVMVVARGGDGAARRWSWQVGGRGTRSLCEVVVGGDGEVVVKGDGCGTSW